MCFGTKPCVGGIFKRTSKLLYQRRFHSTANSTQGMVRSEHDNALNNESIGDKRQDDHQKVGLQDASPVEAAQSIS